MQTLLVFLSLNGLAETKLAILAFLYCEEIMKVLVESSFGSTPAFSSVDFNGKNWLKKRKQNRELLSISTSVKNSIADFDSHKRLLCHSNYVKDVSLPLLLFLLDFCSSLRMGKKSWWRISGMWAWVEHTRKDWRQSWRLKAKHLEGEKTVNHEYHLTSYFVLDIVSFEKVRKIIWVMLFRKKTWKHIPELC